MKRFSSLIAALVLSAAPVAHASMLGDTVSCSQYTGGSYTCQPASAVVGPGVEFQIGPSQTPDSINADFDASELTLTFIVPQMLYYTELSFQDLTTPFSTASLQAQNGAANFTSANIRLCSSDGPFIPCYPGSDLILDLRGVNVDAGNFLSISLSNASSATPEPSSFNLVVTGLFAAGAFLRKARPRLARR